MEFKSELVFINEWPSEKEMNEFCNSSSMFFICDRNLHNFLPSWLIENANVYFVDAGENLKELIHFPHHISKISEHLISVDSKNLTVIGIGGGSVGDFCGFFASTYKRGVKFVSLPTTWLAAIDSSHGGKNALNVSGLKNQIGTYYPAKKVLLIKSILQNQPLEISMSSIGEWIKIGFINRPLLLEALAVSFSKANANIGDIFWKLLPEAIEGKMNLVLKDPKETLGERQKLNLGHTLGHSIESYFKWPHGWAVLQGLLFSLHWSRKKT